MRLQIGQTSWAEKIALRYAWHPSPTLRFRASHILHRSAIARSDHELAAEWRSAMVAASRITRHLLVRFGVRETCGHAKMRRD